MARWQVSLPVLFTCLAQEPDLREEFTAELRKRNPEGAAEAKWETMLKDSSWAACVRQNPRAFSQGRLGPGPL